jgi:hypothetical protein
MNIEYLIQLLENRLSALTSAKDQAFSSGDLERINLIDTEMFGVQDTLGKLKLLLGASQGMAATNESLVQVIQAQAGAITNGSTECLNNYDISSYAADPLYEQKITDILSAIGAMDSPEVIDTYIDNEAIGSPITNQMILGATQQYSVDVRLVMAIIELESNFGTTGVAVNTLNPGNVGNTGDKIKTYDSWNEGVLAVAEWLSRHRIEKIVPETNNTEATTTNSVVNESNTSTTTPEITTPEATSTSPVIPEDATSTPSEILPEATSTPELNATSTQASIPLKKIEIAHA